MERLRKYQNHGMTRIEVSILVDRDRGLSGSNSWAFHNLPKSIGRLIESIGDQILNGEPVRPLVLRYVSFENLMAQFACISTNILLVGDQTSWVVTARGATNRFFVGTARVARVKNLDSQEKFWDPLQNLIKRFASPGATIQVHCLHSETDLLEPVGSVIKEANTLFQAPSCTLPPRNGIRLPVYMRIPIERGVLGSESLRGWEVLRRHLTAEIRAKTTGHPMQSNSIADRVAQRRRNNSGTARTKQAAWCPVTKKGNEKN